MSQTCGETVELYLDESLALEALGDCLRDEPHWVDEFAAIPLTCRRSDDL